jgi:methyl-accepting chemotaxis protein
MTPRQFLCLIHDLSLLLSKQDTTLNLYSGYPFPNRKDRRLDAFQQRAWDYLSNNPQAFLSQNETRDGKNIVRVAVADTMDTRACINCHNNAPDSPKRDWKLGDVRGVLEVTMVIDQQLTHGTMLSTAIIIAVGLIGILLIGITLAVTRSVTKPISGIVGAMRELAKGNTTTAVPGGERSDEIGAVAGAVQAFKETIIEADRLRAEQSEVEERSNEKRRADMHRLASEFEQEVGNIVNTVSSASNELEVAAATLSRTAETTQSLSSTVAASSEEASANVKSVAAGRGRILRINRRDQSASSGVEADCSRGGQAGRNHQYSHDGIITTRIGDVVKLITSVADQTNHWHSTLPLKPPGPVALAKGLPSSPRRSRRSPPKPPRRQTKFPHRSPPCRWRPKVPWPPSRRLATPSIALRKSPPASPQPPRSKMRRLRKSRATCSKPRSVPRRSPPTLLT